MRDTDPKVSSRWEGETLIWTVNGDDISDDRLRGWCANNMGDSPHRYMDIARKCHMVAYANRFDVQP